MTRKCHVRFGGRPTEKAWEQDLAGGLPYVDGHPNPVTLTAGETVTIRFDVAKAGGSVQWTLTRDLSGTGKYDPAYPFHRTSPILDGGADDSDPAPGKIALVFPVLSSVPAGRYVMYLRDSSDDSTVVSPVWTVVPKPEAQAISGRVAIVSDADPTGTAPPDAIIWAATDLQTLVASANIRPDGSYALPLPPGTWFVTRLARRMKQSRRADRGG